MSSGRSAGLAGVIAGLFRGLFIAAATAGAVFGLLVVFHPFDAPASTTAGPPATAALQQQIEAARAALAETQAALDNVKGGATGPASAADTLRTQYEAQIGTATERRDLALRHAAAIRDALKSGLPVASLAEIRDSVVIGQLMSQQAALDAQIAEQGARFKANHPVMRGLAAQRTALAGQIRDEATSIAAALEADAKLDDAQITLLQTRLAGAPPAAVDAAAPDAATLQSQAAAERTELDGLMDAYFATKPGGASAVAARDPLNPLNLIVIVVAGIAAILFQIVLAAGRRAPEPARDAAAWAADRDPDVDTEPAARVEPKSQLRHAS